jgi:hypothetical protein
MNHILPHLPKGIAFEPQDLIAMSMAFDDVCKALKLVGDNNKARETIAERIIELARRGERSPTKLRDRVLAEASAGQDSSGAGPSPAHHLEIGPY